MLDVDNPVASAEYKRVAAFHQWRDMKTVADLVGAQIASDASAAGEVGMRSYMSARVAELEAWCVWLDLTREVTA